MKHFILLRLSVLLIGIGAGLVLTPACEAQSEISPDPFDGTDSWATAARPVHTQPQKQPAAKPSLPAKSQKAAQGSRFQLAVARDAQGRLAVKRSPLMANASPLSRILKNRNLVREGAVLGAS